MLDLSTIPTPGPDCDEWQSILSGYVRYFDGGKRVQYVYADGRHWCGDLDAES